MWDEIKVTKKFQDRLLFVHASSSSIMKAKSERDSVSSFSISGHEKLLPAPKDIFMELRGISDPCSGDTVLKHIFSGSLKWWFVGGLSAIETILQLFLVEVFLAEECIFSKLTLSAFVFGFFVWRSNSSQVVWDRPPMNFACKLQQRRRSNFRISQKGSCCYFWIGLMGCGSSIQKRLHNQL